LRQHDLPLIDLRHLAQAPQELANFPSMWSETEAGAIASMFVSSCYTAPSPRRDLVLRTLSAIAYAPHALQYLRLKRKGTYLSREEQILVGRNATEVLRSGRRRIPGRIRKQRKIVRTQFVDYLHIG
jgi:hypothetical protein